MRRELGPPDGEINNIGSSLPQTPIRHGPALAIITESPPAPRREGEVPGKTLPKLQDWRRSIRAEVEEHYLLLLLPLAGGLVPEACRISGLSKPRLYALLKKYNLTGFLKPTRKV